MQRTIGLVHVAASQICTDVGICCTNFQADGFQSWDDKSKLFAVGALQG